MFVRQGLRDLVAAMVVTALLTLGAVACTPAPAAPPPHRMSDATPYVAASDSVSAGAYLVRVGSCDDCHTVGWPEANGTLPDSMRLMGSSTGFSGPWGTSYPANLRLSVVGVTAEQWVRRMRERTGLPPMPWFSLAHMSDRDMRAIHAYLTALGPKGDPAPAPLPPGVAPTEPTIVFMPVMPGSSQ